MGLFPGGEAAPGRGSGGRASFPQSIPRHPVRACVAPGLEAERTAGGARVAGPGQPNSISWAAAASAQLWAHGGLRSWQLLFV